MSRIVLEKISKRYGPVTALEALDLTATEGELLTLLGPSGCGKTTTLRLIAGFLHPDAGRIVVGDRDVTHDPPNRRGLGMVFQSYALFPHLTVGENVGFPLREGGVAASAVRRRVDDLLELIRLPHLRDRYPAELSGGQQQRVALARAIAREPRVLLMDEPLGALDLKLREAMQMEFRRIQQQLRITTIYVTHDQMEAMRISDKIAVMNNGRIAQFGAAREIYDRPRDKFVSEFVGKINLVPATAIGQESIFAVFSAAGQTFRLPDYCAARPNEAVTVGIRPEDLRIAVPHVDAGEMNTFRGHLEHSLFIGNVCEMTVRLSDGLSLLIEAHPETVPDLVGHEITVLWKPEKGKMFLQ
jgi:spermidine/putrescine ABC transporter ATP-binding subunit